MAQKNKASLLKDSFSSIFMELKHENNEGVCLEKLSTFSSKKVVWECGDCGYKWKATVNSRVKNKIKCRSCSGKAPTNKHNLFIDRPDLMEDWDLDANVLDPTKLNKGAVARAHWKCKLCGYKWVAYVSNRNAGTKCPECNRNKIIP